MHHRFLSKLGLLPVAFSVFVFSLLRYDSQSSLSRIRSVRVCNMQSIISTNIQNQTFHADTVEPHFCLPSPSRRNFEIEHPRCTWATRLRRASATASRRSATCDEHAALVLAPIKFAKLQPPRSRLYRSRCFLATERLIFPHSSSSHEFPDGAH